MSLLQYQNLRSICLALTICFSSASATKVLGAEQWISLFNGKDLSGWTPKIKGYAFGDNYANTFRVEDGAICVRYDGYKDQKFENRFGHLFYKPPFTNYVVRLEYRFVGQQLSDGPGWAVRNSGIMVHCQEPSSIAKDQDFPVCLEVQLLGGDGTNPRHTGNLCTPGTHVVMNDKLVTQHCTDSRSKTYHGSQWVTAEVEVHGNGKIIHRINGENVLEYEKPQLDPSDGDAQKLLKAGANVMVSSGYISLQSESHPVEFRKVEIRPLAE
ncbi:MAG TPA: DUF1080 domain-containing protein [Clostridia bacterium]|nr:DUF1080 domain-containing protein [Clostridia bacterium]